MAKKDLFHKDIEGRLDELKHGKPKKEKASLGENLNKAFVIALGLVILIGLMLTLIVAWRK